MNIESIHLIDQHAVLFDGAVVAVIDLAVIVSFIHGMDSFPDPDWTAGTVICSRSLAYFGKPTACARITFILASSLKTLRTAASSYMPRETVPRPFEAA